MAPAGKYVIVEIHKNQEQHGKESRSNSWAISNAKKQEHKPQEHHARQRAWGSRTDQKRFYFMRQLSCAAQPQDASLQTAVNWIWKPHIGSCNPDASPPAAHSTHSKPLNTMLPALLSGNLRTAHLQHRLDSNPKGTTIGHQRGPCCMGHQEHSYYACRRNVQRTSLQEQASSSWVAQAWFYRDQLQHRIGQVLQQAFAIQRWSCWRINLHSFLPSLTKHCAAILHRNQVSRAGLIFANTMTGLIYFQL